MGGGQKTTTYYDYDDILAMRADSDGKMLLVKKIPKQQSAQTVRYDLGMSGKKGLMTIVGSMSFYR